MRTGICCAGMSNQSSSKLAVRGLGSTGYKIEKVYVEQLQEVFHPTAWEGSVEVCVAKDAVLY